MICKDCGRSIRTPKRIFETFEHFGLIGRIEAWVCPYCGGNLTEKPEKEETTENEGKHGK